MGNDFCLEGQNKPLDALRPRAAIGTPEVAKANPAARPPPACHQQPPAARGTANTGGGHFASPFAGGRTFVMVSRVTMRASHEAQRRYRIRTPGQGNLLKLIGKLRLPHFGQVKPFTIESPSARQRKISQLTHPFRHVRTKPPLTLAEGRKVCLIRS